MKSAPLTQSSGSGKSTLLNIMGTLDNPSQGEVIIHQTKATGLKKDQLAQLRNETIGFIFQIYYLLPDFTVLENILMPYWLKSTHPPTEVKKRAEMLMDLLGLQRVRSNLATQLSGGQQQRTVPGP